MAKLSFNKLGLSKSQDKKEIQYNENTIEIYKYLDIKSKSTLVNAAVRAAVIEGIVDEILADAYLHIFIIEYYTNISFTGKQKENIFETFDLMESNGLIQLVIENIPEDEYNYIFSMAKKLTANLNEFNRSPAGASIDLSKLKDLFGNLPGQTE